MSQAVITKAFSEWKAQQAVNNQPVTLDEFIFAYIPDLDVTKPIDNTEGIPAADKIVHRQAVSKSGVVNANSVVYSVTLGADVGDFSFNWIGLINKATSTLAMIIHAPTQSKIKNASGQQGNVLVRSMLMEYSGAESATNITTPAETWQIDFTARLAAMDERQRLENIDLYGTAAFFGAGYLVSKNGSQYFVTQGVGYVAGLRSVLAANQNITVSTKPVKVWLDVAWSGTLTSEWRVLSKITVAASLADYAENGVQHHVFALASIDASGNITDLRPKGTLDEQAASDALAKHEKSRNHPDATTSEKGFTQLSSETGSDSESKAATPKAVKAVNDDLQKVKKALGTAAGGDVVTSDKDTTQGRIPTVGWMGLGAVSGVSFTDANIPDFNCTFRMNAQGIHGPVAGAPSNIHQFQYDANAGQQIGFRAGVAEAAMYHRSKVNAVWGNWLQVFDTAHPPSPEQVGALPNSGSLLSSIFDIKTSNLHAALGRGSQDATTGMPENSGNTRFAVFATQIYSGQFWVTLISRDQNYTGLVNTSQKTVAWTQVYNTANKPSAGDVDAVSAKNGGTFQKEVLFQGGMRVRSETGIYSGGDAASFSDANMILKSWYGIAFATTLTGGEGITGYINTRSGRLEMKEQIIPGDYRNFDARYYTQTAANGRYVTAIRLGAIAEADNGNNDNAHASAPNGAVVVSVQQKTNWTAVKYRYQQYNINGTWYTAGVV
ncbi:phage tail protein [Enterobacter sp. KB-221C9]|uniref:phage tail-collar fiber domain-containing protein n=1 Tax=Enterobacter sp. KB-221C9 TaxID=3242496 RepID=UPI00352245C9